MSVFRRGSHLKHIKFQRPQRRLGGKMGGQRPGDALQVPGQPLLFFCADIESNVLISLSPQYVWLKHVTNFLLRLLSARIARVSRHTQLGMLSLSHRKGRDCKCKELARAVGRKLF